MFFKYMKWAMLWALIILILCGIPGRGIPHISFLELLSFDKFVHAGIFFVLILLTVRGFLAQTHFETIRKKAKVLAFVLCTTYEVHWKFSREQCLNGAAQMFLILLPIALAIHWG